MNLPLTSVTGLAFKSGHTGRSENGASLFHTWWSISIISSEMRTYTYVRMSVRPAVPVAASPRWGKPHTPGYEKTGTRPVTK